MLTRKDADTQTLSSKSQDGTLAEVDLDLQELAALERGKAVAFYGEDRVRHFTLDEQIARGPSAARTDHTLGSMR